MKKAFVLLAILLIGILLITACGKPTPTPSGTPTTSPTPSAGTPQKGGTLRYIYPYSPATTPGWPNDRANPQKLWMQWVCFEGLIKLKADGTPLPWLATSWEWGPQNQYITFTLRQGVKFHDGTDFTAEAVKTEGDIVISTGESNAVNWDRWEIINDYSVRLYLKEYLNDFWGTVAGVNMTFISPTAYKANGQEWMMEHPIGTGPFKFLSFEKDVSLKFVRNDNYWQPGKPYLDEIHFITVKEALTQQATMQTGDGDVLALQQGKILADMKALGFNVVAQYGGTDFLIFDTANPDSIYNNINLRKAIEYALPKQEMVDALGYGFLVVNNQMPPPDNPAHNPNVPTRDYDPDMARQLLDEGGLPVGTKLNIITIGSSGKALAIQEALGKVGLEVTLESVDNAKFWNYCMAGWSNAILDVGYAVGTNFAAWLRGYFPPVGVLDVSCKIPDAIVAKIQPALREQDPVKAKALNDEIIQMLFDDATFVPIYSNAMGYILATKVKGSGILTYADFSVWDPADTWLEE